MSYEERIAATTPRKAKLTVADFMLLSDGGAFANFARAELIEGEIYVVNSVYRPHARVRQHLTSALITALMGRDDGLTVLGECSTLLSDSNMPQPDIILTTEPDGEGPIPLASISLIVEVADSSLKTDLGLKAGLYARHGIAEYWVADIGGKRIVRHWHPEGEAYAQQDEVPFGDTCPSRKIDGLRVATADLG